MSKRISLTPLIRQNPFGEIKIPNRMSWTSSALRLFRKCKRKFFWKYMMKLKSRSMSKDLIIGSAFHHVLGEWYRGSRSTIAPIVQRYLEPIRTQVNQAADWFDQDELDKFVVMANTFTGMLLGYGYQYQEDKSTWVINRKSIEAQFKVNMGDFDFMGKIDLVAKGSIANPGGMTVKGKNFVVEHKTASSIRDSYIDRLPLDTQVRAYVFGAQRGLGLSIDSVLYDVVKKCKLRRKSNESIDGFNQRVAKAYIDEPQDYFYRELLDFDKSDVLAFEHELHQTHKEYESIIFPLKGKKLDSKESWDILFGASGSPTDPRSWAPNDGTCDEFFRLCDYHELCSKGLDNGTGLSYDQVDEMHQELIEES